MVHEAGDSRPKSCPGQVTDWRISLHFTWASTSVPICRARFFEQRELTTPIIMICEMVSLAYMAPSCLGTFGPMRAFVVQTRWIVECLTRLPCERRRPVLL
jgi:hypothetical protein